ncbi:hypothetical protein B0J11DRAFT_483531 [Dendryphion nanum]|uniref:Peptidase S54 rhomboid domain-containing protein n=1 Tax=Dendryphion nanum TaxID=256645 RepID=A0A9P9E4W7_9PLEO|nr:hypothetical protein B0J11DRAFT_483531 [Dendryphion nanum]
MSATLPMGLMRPSCAAVRHSAPPVTQQWNSVTRAFARRFCSQNLSYKLKPKPCVLATIRSHISAQPRREFSTIPQRAANVVPDRPVSPTSRPAPRKREVLIGQLPSGNVDKRTIGKIFGPKVSEETGNNVLRILHHRRTSGSLADYGVDNLGKSYIDVTQKTAIRALEWLRETHPVDEARAAEEWAEKEANRISYELWLADPENADSKYNDPARIYREQQKEFEAAQEEEEGKRIGILRAGPSEFERNIKQKRQERLEEIAKKAEKKEAEEKEMEKKIATGEWVRTPGGTALMKPGQTAYVDVFGREQVSHYEAIQQRYREQAESPFKSEEEMRAASTVTQRLWPMSAFVIGVCILSYGFAHYYMPPAREYRIWPDLSLTTATMLAIIGTNVVICGLWRWTPLWPFMTKYFMHVPGYPRAVQAITNVFSHIQYEHLLGNMMFLGLIGSACHELVDRGVFVGTYMSAGAIGTLVSLYWANIGRGSITSHSVGASAALWGVSTLYALLTEQETIKIPFVKDTEVGFYPKMLLAAFVVSEIMAARKKTTTMDHASHFGGMLVGAIVAGYLRATGFHEQRNRALAESVEAGEEPKSTLDVGALVSEEVAEVKESVKKIVK